MTYRGHIRNGVIVLDEAVQLPEGAEVDVAIRDNGESGGGGGAPAQSLYELAGDLIDTGDDLPPDASANKNHYLYGHPKP